jgi:aromatic ring hydroxylase
MMTGKEYIESLKALELEVYFMGRKITRVADEPMFQPHIHTAAMTYELAHDPEYEAIMTARSHLDGAKINRFTHIHYSIEDLVKKSRWPDGSKKQVNNHVKGFPAGLRPLPESFHTAILQNR